MATREKSTTILIATGLYPPEIGGPATYTKMLEDELPKRGITVLVLPFSTVRHLPKVVRHVVYFGKLLWRARSARLIFAQDPVSVGFPALCAAKLLRKQFFIRMPGDYAWEQARQRWGVTDTIDVFQKKTYTRAVEYLRKLQVFVTRHADMVITPSDYFSTLVRGWGIQPHRVVTIYNGINFDIQPKKPNVQVRPGEHILVSAGRLVPWKGFSFLIDLLHDLPNWRLVIIGDGPLEETLTEEVELAGLTDRVLLPGAVPRAELLGWLQVADAFALNTSFESFSFQVVEALYVGTPVITTNIGSLPELITDGKEGILLTPDDRSGFLEAIVSTVHDVEAWRVRREFAYSKAKRFSIAATCAAVVEQINR